MNTRIGRRSPLQTKIATLSAVILTSLAMLMVSPLSAQAADSAGGNPLAKMVSLAPTGMDLPRWLLLGVFVLITGVGLLVVARLVIPKRDQPAKPLD